MKKLNVYIIKTFLGPFVATFLIAVFVLLMNFLWRYIDELVGKGLSFGIIIQILGYASAALVPMALPLAVLLSSLMTFGNLAEHNELVAIKSSGISLPKIMRPLVYMAIAITIGAFIFSNYVLPIANLKYRTLLFDIKEQPAEVMIPEGTFYNGIEGYSIRVEKKNKDSKMMYGILIYNHSDRKGNTTVSYADSGRLDFTEHRNYLILTQYNGYQYEEVKSNNNRRDKSYPLRREIFDEKQIVFDLSGYTDLKRSDENIYKNHYQMLSVDQLEQTIDSLKHSLDQSRNQYKNQIIQRAYFKRLGKKNDSLFDQLTDSIPPLNIDSLYNSTSLHEKKLLIKSAISYARSTQSQISNARNTVKNKNIWLVKHKIVWHEKFTLSVACLLLFFVGAPLGAIIRKGGIGFPTIISVLMFILYYIISISGKKYVKELAAEPQAGMWISTIVFLPIGIYLTFQAAKDRMVFDIDRAMTPIYKFINRILVLKRYRRIKEARANRINSSQPQIGKKQL